MSGSGVAGWAVLCATALLFPAVVDLSWALTGARARSRLRSRRAVMVANRTGASMMPGAALAIAAHRQ